LALARSAKVFFQNQDDLDAFVSHGLVQPTVVGRLPGSGVNLAQFQVLPPKPDSGRVTFLLIARMLWDKGVGEFVRAAAQIKAQYPHAEFALLGFLDVQNPSAVSRSQMDEWVAQGVVAYWGVSDDVRNEVARADVVVLPSFYREGTPRTLLEAAAMGKPIITTRAVGCKDVVDDGVNGYLCEPKSADDLATAMHRLLGLSADERAEMGRQGRLKMEREFDERFVVDRYLHTIAGLSKTK
jgi:glycosyltransferase involved in cell wall biosynthesis